MKNNASRHLWVEATSRNPRIECAGAKVKKGHQRLQSFLAAFLSALLVCAPLTVQAAPASKPQARGEHVESAERQDLGVPISKEEMGALVMAQTTSTSGKEKTKNSKSANEDLSPVASAKGENLEEEYPPLLIGPGDLLFISVTGYERSNAGETGRKANPNSDLPTDYLVSSSGKIFFPFVGSVKLAGLTPIEASVQLMKKLSGYLRYPQVTVLIKETNTYNISVIGNVMKPAQYMIRGRPTLVSMVSLAGGPTPNADLGGVLVTRGTEKIKVDLGRLLTDKNYHQEGPIVYPGDVIYVPRNPWPTLGELAVVVGIIYSAVIVTTTLSK